MNDNWTKEDYLDNPFVMAHLQHLTEYQKESLLGMIEAKTILPHLQKIANAVFKVWDRYQDNPIDSKDKQTITFASAASSSSNPLIIGVSDGEMAGVTESGYTFKPTYLNNPEIAANTDVFLLDTEGASFKKTAAADVKITAFRPYFTAPTGTNPARQTRGVEQIVFGQSNSQFGVEEHGDPSEGELNGGLKAYAKKHQIIVESSLNLPVEVRIVNTAGITVNTFTLESGESVETRVNNSGVYIVHSADGQYTKKLSVK